MLLLESNFITRIPLNCFEPVKETLITLDLSKNKIEFKPGDSEDYVKETFAEIKKLKLLTILNLYGNPFVKQFPHYKVQLNTANFFFLISTTILLHRTISVQVCLN